MLRCPANAKFVTLDGHWRRIRSRRAIIIQNFKEMRRDGKVIDENLTTAQLLSLGWAPEKVNRIEWEYHGQPVVVPVPHSMISRVVPERDAVMVIEKLDDTGFRNRLLVLNADGSVRLTIPNEQLIKGRPVHGEFGWFEPARVSGLPSLGIVFQPDNDSSMYVLDVDASNGTTLGVYPTR
jgi:hypothetical protein